MTGPCIITTYRGPTETRGAKIVARCLNLRSMTISFNHELSATENHALAARVFASRHWGSEVRLASGVLRIGVEAHIVVPRLLDPT